MADKKISALTAATTPLDGTEVLPIVQSGSTVKVANNDLRPKQIQSNATSGVLQIAGPAAAATRVMTVPNANFTAARTDAAQSFTGDQTLSTGNLIQGTAAKGFNFAANTPAAGMTTQLLAWYEEGTWTPVIGGETSESGQSYTVQRGQYVRVGKQVTCTFDVVLAAKGTITGDVVLKGLPFTSASSSNFAYPSCNIGLWQNFTTAYVYINGVVINNSTYAALRAATAAATSLSSIATANISDTTRISGTVVYFAN